MAEDTAKPAAKTGAPEAKPAGSPPKPSPAAKAPAKPAGAKTPKGGGPSVSRRAMVSWLALAWAGFVAAISAATAATVRFLYPNVLFEPPQSFKIGFPEDFAIGVDTRFKEKFGVWVVRHDDGFAALLSVCTHLGCTPNWLEAEQKFKCPCHGSGFRMTGIHFEGPAPRPLERARIVLADDGQILVDKTRKFQQEKGEWEDPESFLKV